MTCEQINCLAHVFSTCPNHCEKKFCLEHLIEHEDKIFHEYQILLNKLDKSNENLFHQVNQMNTKILQRRDYEIDRIQTLYSNEQQKLEQEYQFLENAYQLYQIKQLQLKKSLDEQQCLINQHDFQQIKSYEIQLKQFLTLLTFDCPLKKSTNIFGTRFHLDTLINLPCQTKELRLTTLIHHLETFHQMKHEYAKKIFEAMENQTLDDHSILFRANQSLGRAKKKH